MNPTTIKRTRWFWPWQDAKEESWLESMSLEGWHLISVGLPCVYSFASGEACRYTYRLDYMPMDKAKWDEYRQIFQEAGWDYIGEMSNWRYWRKQVAVGETAEIFTDTESKIRKYRRMLGYMGFFLMLLVFLGTRIFFRPMWANWEDAPVASVIYMVGGILYAVVIPMYIVVVVQLLRRISQLKRRLSHTRM
jgi:hypothetical protein